MQTLILTQGYMPHRVVDWKKAITMSFTGKVEVVETYDEVVRSVSAAFLLPAVVRLIRPIRRGKPRIRFSRANVFIRDGRRCQYCGVRFETRELTLDHVIPRSRGGTTGWTNIVTACRPCNSAKGDKTLAEARLKLLNEPVRPHRLTFPIVQLRVRPCVPDAWKSWVFWQN